jgi:hypothetical protein
LIPIARTEIAARRYDSRFDPSIAIAGSVSRA